VLGEVIGRGLPNRLLLFLCVERGCPGERDGCQHGARDRSHAYPPDRAAHANVRATIGQAWRGVRARRRQSEISGFPWRVWATIAAGITARSSVEASIAAHRI